MIVCRKRHSPDRKTGVACPLQARRAEPHPSGRGYPVLHTLSTLGSLLWVALAGCRGGGQIQFVPLNYRDVHETRPLIPRYDLDACYWWQDEAGKVHVSMGFSRGALLSEPYRVRFGLAMDLEEPPAGKARNYPIRGRKVYAKASQGYTSNYLVSVYGVVGVWTKPGRQLRGRCRMTMMQKSFSPIFGYSRAGQTILVADFIAVYDEKRGSAIRDQAVEAAENRSGPGGPASMPARRTTTHPGARAASSQPTSTRKSN